MEVSIMRCLVQLPVLIVTILVSQAISTAPGLAQPAKAHVGAKAMAIISGHPSATVATLPVSATANAPASSNGITVNVPQVVPFGAQTYNDRMQITNLTVTLNFAATAPVTLTFISPDNFANGSNQWQVTLSPGMPVDSSCRGDRKAVKCHDFPVPSNLTSCLTCTDNITIVPGSGSGGSMQFLVKFALLSNYNVGGSGSGRCASTQSQDPKKYQILPDQAVTGACVESYSKHLDQCTSNVNLIHLSPGDGARVDGASCSK
jgi:hypothetical protein